MLSRRIAVPAFLIALTALSAFLRTRQLNAGFWIDEGLSVGIAHHHWSSIPGLLRQDGSPPGYYLLLGLWIRLFGDGERATHTLSLALRARVHPGSRMRPGAPSSTARPASICATLAAFDPFLTYYAQETRMYEVEALLSIVVAYAYVQGVLRGRDALGGRARAGARRDGLRAQLGALPLRRAGCGDGALRAPAVEALRTRRGGRRTALPALGADRPVAGAAHRRAVVDLARFPRSRACTRRGGQRRRGARRARARRRRRPARTRGAPGRRRALRRARAGDRDRGDGRAGVALVAVLARRGRRATSRSCSGRSC